MKGRACLILWVLVCCGDAWAQSPAGSAEAVRKADASHGRGIVMTRADTRFVGELSIDGFDKDLLGAGYGLTDSVEASAAFLVPVIRDQTFGGILGVKWAFDRKASTVMAVSSKLVLASPGSGLAGVLGAGFHIDHHLTEMLGFHGALELEGIFGAEEGEFDVVEAAFLTASGGVSVRASDHIHAIAELVVGARAGKDDVGLNENAQIAYGVRFASQRISVDVAFLKPVGSTAPSFRELPFGLPYWAFSAVF